MGCRMEKEVAPQEDLPCARPYAEYFTCLLYVLLARTLRGKYCRPISQTWKLRHGEVLHALPVSSHLIFTDGSGIHCSCCSPAASGHEVTVPVHRAK